MNIRSLNPRRGIALESWDLFDPSSLTEITLCGHFDEGVELVFCGFVGSSWTRTPGEVLLGGSGELVIKTKT